MTKKEIKKAFRRGLGRGILAVREDPERYRDLVLWACGKNLSFDTQCEGTRAWYDYRLVSCYSNKSEFRDHVIKLLSEKKPDPGWDYAHFSELLMYFAEDGDRNAETALWTEYAELLLKLKKTKRYSRSLRNTIFCFEYICVSLSWNREKYCRIAGDIGSLFIGSSNCDAWDFEWLYESRPRGFNSELKKKSASSQELKAYFSAFEDLKRVQKARSDNRTEGPVPEGGRALSVYLKRKAPELAVPYARSYLSQSEPEARAAALEAFFVCPYPLDPAPVLTDAGSACPALRAAALEALAEIRDQKVRDFARAHINDDIKGMLPILIRNYRSEDEAFLYKYISGLQVDHKSDTVWHGIYMEILDLFDPDSGVTKPPKSLLPIMYESTLCSYCRKRIVRLMGKYRMISGSMWKELLYDSNEEIRAYAEAHCRRIGLSAE